MAPAFKIAWRYFRGKKSAQAINIISWISIGAIAVSSAAMIVLFSVFNGLEDTVKGMYSAFNPGLKVRPSKGKFFTVTDEQLQAVRQLPGIAVASLSLEDMVLLTGDEEQRVGTLKGVDDSWFKVSHIDSFMTDGQASWPQRHDYTPAIMGLGVSIALGIDVNNAFAGLRIYYPKPGIPSSEDPQAGLNSIVVKPQGNFRIQDEFDGQYVLVPLEAARRLFGAGNRASSIEIALKPGTGEGRLRQALKEIMGEGIIIENRFEQNKTFYMIMRSEKWAVYAILLMVLLIASFNMIGSLSMVVLEKKKDIAILKSMGARRTLIHSVFLTEGGLLALFGALIGVLAGLLLCLGQHYYGWISLPEGFIIDAYPVLLQAQDFLLVVATALAVGLLAAWYPAYKASRQAIYVREE